MTITHICGWEMAHAAEAQSVVGTAATSTLVRSGARSLRCNPTAATGYVTFSSRAAAGSNRALYKSVRFYLRVWTLPSAATDIAGPLSSVGSGLTHRLRLNADGTLSLVNSSGSVVATSTLTFSSDGAGGSFHRIDFDAGWNTSTSGLRVYVDGVEWASDSAATCAVAQVGGMLGSSTTATADLFFDDVVWYDSALPATLTDYNVGLLLPTSDSADGGWKMDDATTTADMWTALDNRPPIGDTTTVNFRRIENTVSSATDNYDAVCAAYQYLGGTYVPSEGSPSGDAVGFSATQERTAGTFVMDTNQPITSVRLMLWKAGSPTDNLEVVVQADSSGSPSGTDLASASVAGTSLTTTPTSTSVALSFTPTKNTTYWLVFRRSGSLNSSNYYNVGLINVGIGPSIRKKYVSGAWVLQSGEAHTMAFVTSDPTILAVQAICNDAQAVTTGSPKAGAVVITANPSGQTEQSFDYGLPNGLAGSTSAAAMGTFPAGWGSHVGPVTESPSVTLSSGPTVRVGKRTATTREVDVDFLAVYVVWAAAAKKAPPFSTPRLRPALMRS